MVQEEQTRGEAIGVKQVSCAVLGGVKHPTPGFGGGVSALSLVKIHLSALMFSAKWTCTCMGVQWAGDARPPPAFSPYF